MLWDDKHPRPGLTYHSPENPSVIVKTETHFHILIWLLSQRREPLARLSRDYTYDEAKYVSLKGFLPFLGGQIRFLFDLGKYVTVAMERGKLVYRQEVTSAVAKTVQNYLIFHNCLLFYVC